MVTKYDIGDHVRVRSVYLGAPMSRGWKFHVKNILTLKR